ncbi:FG-GAP-like repeat-containing protein [Leptolyngbya sp. NIES-2104]|uniref:FG-GAP-like repeat-containing protein n=1 Tax=Leptolyngbya sp. NIES-2104 TaxID=1552121 RepID=UPI0006EC9911|nr:FG-GAP-like repeat-containing protein [Leptolyngbya sp. NIES-2104]GAP98650.1 alkaline phosphatase [Leptolyngbya sp. NIES-2104]
MVQERILTESFRNADVEQFNWIFGTSRSTALPPILTARGSSSASFRGLPGGGTDTPGNGALRLTNNTQNQGSFVIYDKPLNSASGLSVQFDLYSYGGSSPGADGISFFLIDGSANPTTAGGVGGSLGYSSNSTPGEVGPGIVGGYLGIGFDEFGNFAVNRYGSGGIASADRVPQSITVRGREGLNYPFITTTGRLPGGATIDSTSTTRPEARRRVGVDLSNTGLLSVSFDLNGDGTLTSNERVISDFNVTTTNGALPGTFKFGFAASTGGSTNFHELNNLQINTFDGPYRPLVEFPSTTRVIKPTGTFEVTATIDVATTQTVTIPLEFTGTALRGTDYNIPGSITIAPGQTTGSVTLTGLINSPTVSDKTIEIRLGTPTNADRSPQNSTKNVLLTRMSDNDCAIPDFNGDNKVDIPWRNVNSNETAIWLIDGTKVVDGSAPGATDPGWEIVSTRDFNADGKTDLLWRNSITGGNSLWLMDGKNVLRGESIASVADTNWQVIGSRDFNNDGTADIFWRNRLSGDNVVWLMNSFNVIDGRSIGVVSTDWQISDFADFNNDGKADVAWRNSNSGGSVVWLMNGSTVSEGRALVPLADPNWEFVAARDTSGDGKADIIWRQRNSGQTVVWLMDGATVAGGGLLSAPDANWQIADVCDFNADGKADIVWRHRTSGENAIWLLDGATVSTGALIPTVADVNWEIVAARDTNRDNKADLIWRNRVNGGDAIWLVDGTEITAGEATPTVDTGWQIRIRPKALAL